MTSGLMDFTNRNQLADSCHRKRRAGLIALGALNGDQLCPFINGFTDIFKIKIPVWKQIHLPVSDPVFGQGARLGADADNALQCIIRFSHRGKQFIPRPEIAGQRNRQRMSAAGNMRPHESILRMKNMGVDLFQCIPSQIIITISGRRLK